MIRSRKLSMCLLDISDIPRVLSGPDNFHLWNATSIMYLITITPDDDTKWKLREKIRSYLNWVQSQRDNCNKSIGLGIAIEVTASSVGFFIGFLWK